MIELELTDYQTFITERARENYFNSVKQYYDCVRFADENHQYHLYLYTKKCDPIEENWKTQMQREFDIMGAYAMSDAEHLIENVILAMVQNRVDEELNTWYNQRMMQNTGIKQEDLYRMAQHIVYSLYEGLNPFDEHYAEVMDYYHYLKEQDHAPKYV